MYGYIYKTTNIINGKIYIGQKKSETFLAEKYLGSGVRLHSAIAHYGKENFKVEIIEEIQCSEMMDEREIYWINFYNSTDKNIGYNISTGGNVNKRMLGENNPFYGKHHTEESKEKNAEKHRGLKQSAETIAKRVAKNKGKKRTEETKKILSEQKLGDKNPAKRPDVKLKKSLAAKGRVDSPETINKRKQTYSERKTAFKKYKEAGGNLLYNAYIKECKRRGNYFYNDIE